MTSFPSSAGLAMRQLPWPALPPVDLLNECRWLVTLGDSQADPARKPRQLHQQVRQSPQHESELKQQLQRDSSSRSPYRLQLRRPKTPALPGSPAQRAAKSILKLKEELQRVDERKWTLEEDNALDKQPMSGLEARPPQKLSESSPRPTTRETFRLAISSPLKTANSPQRSPGKKKKKKKRPPSREERDLVEKQTRLADWLKTNPDKPSHPIQDAKQSHYSAEVDARIQSAMQCRAPLDSDVGLWDDPVRSLIAAEMTSESVFGGAVLTRALAFQPPKPASPARIVDESTRPSSPDKLTETLVVRDDNSSTEQVNETLVTEPKLTVQAQKVFDTAHRQVSDGAVADAIATLETGIRQALSVSQARLDAIDTSQGVGFNYSATAHANATTLQLCYRARHRRRIRKLVFLQQRWRFWHARRQTSRAKQFEHKQAQLIQRRYRSWIVHITRVHSATRIQRCFRLFERQKYLIRFHQACRWLLARAAGRRRLKLRMKLVGRMVSSLLHRRRRIALVQGLWRGRCARAQLVALVAQAVAAERERCSREDEFVAERLVEARQHFRAFLTTTKYGRELVRWQQEKPWLRFCRLRHSTKQWEELPLSERIAATTRLLPGRKFRGLQQRALCQMLVGRNNQLPARPKQLVVSSEALEFLDISPAVPTTPGIRDRLWSANMRQCAKLGCEKLPRYAAIGWWKLVTWPKECCIAHVWPTRGHRKRHARQALEDDCARVLEAFLRVWFRRMDRVNSPRYTCQWCAAPFATYRELSAHDKCAAARVRADSEWTELSRDLEFVQRKRWRPWAKSYEKPMHPALQSFTLDAATVRRLRRSCSHRRALAPLLATLEACMCSNSNQDETVPLVLVAFVLQHLDNSSSPHPLTRTAEHQLVRWETLIEESSGVEAGWIRKHELRARLVVGSDRVWRAMCRLPRAMRSLVPGKRRDSMIAGLLAQRSFTSPDPAPSARVLPIAT